MLKVKKRHPKKSYSEFSDWQRMVEASYRGELFVAGDKEKPRRRRRRGKRNKEEQPSYPKPTRGTVQDPNFIVEDEVGPCSRIILCTIWDAYNLHNNETIFFGTRPNFKSMESLEGLSRDKHFGNPFFTDAVANRLSKKYKRKFKGFGGVPAVSRLFVEWVKGNVHKKVEPTRREWIYEQIVTGMLDEAKFTYYASCKERTSHILELIKFIDQVKEKACR